MRFIIKRTSLLGDDYSPHPTAYRVQGPRWVTDKRTCKTFEEFDAKLGHYGGPFLSHGRNHKQVLGGISREVLDHSNFWCIDLPDLEALVEFTNANGDLVVSFDIEPEIEIYDSYRE